MGNGWERALGVGAAGWRGIQSTPGAPFSHPDSGLEATACIQPVLGHRWHKLGIPSWCGAIWRLQILCGGHGDHPPGDGNSKGWTAVACPKRLLPVLPDSTWAAWLRIPGLSPACPCQPCPRPLPIGCHQPLGTRPPSPAAAGTAAAGWDCPGPGGAGRGTLRVLPTPPSPHPGPALSPEPAGTCGTRKWVPKAACLSPQPR